MVPTRRRQGSPRLPAPTIAARAIAVACALLLLLSAVRLLRYRVSLPPEPIDWVLGFAGALLGARMVAYAPRNSVGWLFLLAAVLAAVTAVTATCEAVVACAWLRDWVWWPRLDVLAVLALVFPDGRAGGRAWRVVLCGTVLAVASSSAALAVATAADPGGFFLDQTSDGSPAPGGVLLWFLVSAAGVAVGAWAGVGRLLSAARRATGRARAIVVCGLAGGATFVVAVVVDTLWGEPWLSLAVALPFPVAVAVAIVRHGLCDIDLLVHRTLLYGTLSLAAVVGYGLLVTLTVRAGPPESAVVVAPALLMLLLPARVVTQRTVDRLVYGVRRTPEVVAAQLGQRLAASWTPNEILPAVVATIAGSLKLPYAAIRRTPTGPAVAEYGIPGRGLELRLPLSVRGELIGELTVHGRSPEEGFTSWDRRALTDLARQASTTLHAVRLVEEVQRARERLVLGREEERRRLRRDLHDGVGPTLAGMTMQIGVAHKLLASGRAEDGLELIRAVEAELTECAGEIRRVVRGLRPPVLDELGLVAAIREHAERFNNNTGRPIVAVDASGLSATPLPAATEVAAWRIASEAITNVARHAAARRCDVILRTMPGRLEIEVIDDGCGIRSGPAGVGIHGMRERAAELSGACEITAECGGGTRVSAWLPLPTPAAT